MKKLVTLTALALVLCAPLAYAEHHESQKPGGMLEKSDTNGDGMISKEEFMKIHEDRFAEIDANGDGQISKDEAQARRAEWKEKMKEKRQEWKDKHNAEQAPAETE